MPKRPSIPRAARTPFGPDGEPKTVQDVSHRVRRAAARQNGRRGGEPAPAATPSDFDATTPLLKLAGAALFGLALGTIIHRRAAPKSLPAPPRPRPRPAPVYQASRPADGQRSHVRFR
jgi:hypothetical protein